MEYQYEKKVRIDKLYYEILKVLNLDFGGKSTGYDGYLITEEDTLIVYSYATLTPTQKATLDAIIANHTLSFPEADFNIQLFFKRFAETFTVLERLEFAKLAPSFTSELAFFNFPEIKVLRDYLISEEAISPTQADQITALFAEQNIDLDSYGDTGA